MKKLRLNTWSIGGWEVLREEEDQLHLGNQRELRDSGQEISDEDWSAIEDFIEQARQKPSYQTEPQS